MNKYKKIIKVVSIANPKLRTPIKDLELSSRTKNCLKMMSYWLIVPREIRDIERVNAVRELA